MIRKRRIQDKGLGEKVATSPNSQIAAYLFEWYEQAALRDDRLKFVYRRALMSLLELSEPIASLKDLVKLHGIGPNIRSKIEKKFSEDKGSSPPLSQQILSGPSPATPNTGGGIELNREKATLPPNQARKSNTREYLPAFRSGPYAMLIALYLDSLESSSKGYLFKNEIISLGQPYCLTPMEEGTFSPIQGAIKTLTAKGLVKKSSIPARYSLAATGMELAERLWNSGERRSSAPPPVVGGIPSSSPIAEREVHHSNLEVSNSEPFETFTLNKESFDVILIVDTREIKSREERDFIINRLTEAGVLCKQRTLELGDFLWVARAKDGIQAPDEIMLEYIVERKREDDLLSSISDGRFMEQKFRLKASGIKNLVYLVEKSDTADFRSIGQERFNAAIMRTQIIDKMFLRYTNGLEDTLRFLVSLTREIVNQTLGFDLNCGIMSFPVRRKEYFSFLQEQSSNLGRPFYQSFGCYTQLNGKSAGLTVRDIFLKQLLTIRHVTIEKASKIVSQFPTAMTLWRHYNNELPSKEEREQYFKDWKGLDNNKNNRNSSSSSSRRFGPTLSRRLYRLFCDSYKDDDTL